MMSDDGLGLKETEINEKEKGNKAMEHSENPTISSSFRVLNFK